MELQSDLWLDQSDAHERIDEQCRDGRITSDEATKLHTFVDLGFLTFSIDIDANFTADFDADVSRLWQERPVDLAVSPPGPGGPTSFRDYEGRIREAGYRIPDLHSHSDRALDLYLDPVMFRMVALIYGQPAISFQSLYFEYGSEQALHRDPMFVITDPPAHLLASWVALEDISPESGPLAYVPGSHRLPWFEFEPGSVVCGHRALPEQRRAFKLETEAEMAARGMAVQRFTCKRGDAFIWHAGLVHGGSPIIDSSRTRKSFVTHYCTAANYHSRSASMRVRDGERWLRAKSSTDRIIERDHRRGLDNPTRQ